MIESYKSQTNEVEERDMSEDRRQEYVSEFALPSKGQFYGDELPGGVVTCRPWGVQEEKILAGARRGSGHHALLDRIFSRVLEDCPLSVSDWIIHDRLALLLHLRVISTGQAMYPFAFRCEDCGEQNQAWIDLDNLPLRDPPVNMVEPFETDLDCAGVRVSWRYLRGRDEALISKYGRQVRQKGGAGIGDPEYDRRLAFAITHIDGVEVKLQDALKLVSDLRGPDSLALRNAMDDMAFGPRLEVEDQECSFCGWAQMVQLPLNEEFFRPRRKYRSPDGDPRGTALADHGN
jgi:hypothetical protein